MVGIGFFLSLVLLKMPLASVLVMLFLLARVVGYLSKTQRAYQQVVVRESAYWALIDGIGAAHAQAEPKGGDRMVTLSGSIVFDHVRFRHGDGRLVLDDASFVIPARELTVIVGPSGAGKTTMVLEQGELQANIAVVYEGQMLRPEQSFGKLDAALAQGLKPEIIAVQPRPETALENTFNRFDHVGRGASIQVMSQIQGELAEGLRKIHAHYGDRVDLRVIDTREVAHNGQATEYKGWQHLQILESEGTRDAIKDRLAAELGVVSENGKQSTLSRLQQS
jgi:ABC-type dipeptide/oligopeptide/nickel transport system ATPase subunit